MAFPLIQPRRTAVYPPSSVAGRDIRVRVYRPAPLLLLLGALLGAGCGGGMLVSPDAGGSGGGGGLGGIGAFGGDAPGGSSGNAPGGSGGLDGGPPPCPVAPSVVACEIGTPGVGLSSPDQAFVSIGGTLRSWNAGAQAWDTIFDGLAALSSAFKAGPVVTRFDSHGQPVLAYLIVSDAAVATMYVRRWNGLGWTSLTSAPTTVGTALPSTYDVAVDSLDRIVLLLAVAPSTPSAPQLRVVRREGTVWTDLAGAAPINSALASSAHLALDSGDGVTPYVVYQPDADPRTIVPARFDGVTWSEQPSLTRGQQLAFDFAVAGGQMYVAYADGASADAARLFLAQGDSAGWSPVMRLDADVDQPVRDIHMLTLGPSSNDLLVAWETPGGTPDGHEVLFKQAPDWSQVAGATSLSPSATSGFAIAADPTRIGVVWSNLYQQLQVVTNYVEFAR
jgi:hypothetical protein